MITLAEALTLERPDATGWAIIFIAVSVAIIWALTAHGHDITEA